MGAVTETVFDGVAARKGAALSKWQPLHSTPVMIPDCTGDRGHTGRPDVSVFSTRITEASFLFRRALDAAPVVQLASEISGCAMRAAYKCGCGST